MFFLQTQPLSCPPDTLGLSLLSPATHLFPPRISLAVTWPTPPASHLSLTNDTSPFPLFSARLLSCHSLRRYLFICCTWNLLPASLRPCPPVGLLILASQYSICLCTTILCIKSPNCIKLYLRRQHLGPSSVSLLPFLHQPWHIRSLVPWKIKWNIIFPPNYVL